MVNGKFTPVLGWEAIVLVKICCRPKKLAVGYHESIGVIQENKKGSDIQLKRKYIKGSNGLPSKINKFT